LDLAAQDEGNRRLVVMATFAVPALFDFAPCNSAVAVAIKSDNHVFKGRFHFGFRDDSVTVIVEPLKIVDHSIAANRRPQNSVFIERQLAIAVRVILAQSTVLNLLNFSFRYGAVLVGVVLFEQHSAVMVTLAHAAAALFGIRRGGQCDGGDARNSGDGD
jgi:hypothetical protein